MKKILIFALALIALSGCNKKTKESDAERAYLAIYLPAVEQSALLRGMVYHAQRLNLLMNQTDDWSDLNNVPSADGEVNYKESFFGSAQITNDNGRVTIDFGNNYINVKGCVIIDTHNALLSADGTTWELVEVTSDEDKFQEMNMDIAWKFDSWESFEITNSAGSLDCQARGVVIATGAAQSNWNLDFTIIPGSGTMTDIQKWSEGKHSVKAGSRGWGMHFLLGLVELAAGIILCFNTGAALWLVMTVVGSFILVRSVLEVVLGAKFKDDGADKALMIISGLIGTVLGILVLVNTQASASIVMILLGAYSLVFGAMSLLYGARTHKVLHKR